MDRYRLSLSGREHFSYVLVAAIFLILTIGLIKLQIVEHKDLAIQSENNRIRVEPIVPRRGVVYDREGRVIIDNRPSYTLSVVPSEIVAGKTIVNLARLLGLDTAQIRQRIQNNMVSPFQPSTVKRDLPFEAVAVLEEQSKEFPGVTYQLEEVRQYDHNLGAESFTGYVGEVSVEELKKSSDAPYRLGSIIGKKGLEKSYDNILRGHEGTAYIEVSAAGQMLGPYEDKEEIPSVPGDGLVLSIDNDLQMACSQALDTFCCGAIVAMDPRSGEIIAMTSYPSYDANIFSSVVPETLWQEIRSDSTHPLLNRPLNGLYPPGSTAKFIAAGAGLEEGAITENSTFKPCYGGLQFGNRYFRCWAPSGHGSVTVTHAIEQSCDVYFYQLGLKLGVDKLGEYYTRCGFGQSTQVDLPQESPGLIPNSKYYDKRYGERKWSRALALNNAIGQGEILVTPLQLAQFYCGLANNGVVYQPHFVRKIIEPSGQEISIPPKVAFKLPFSPATLGLLREGLRLVVEGDHGTARRLRNKYYSVGGKTGTAENPHGDNHSWFVGVAPLENPEIVVCALVENAGHGSEIAAPLAGEIIKAYMMKKLQIQTGTVAATGVGQ